MMTIPPDSSVQLPYYEVGVSKKSLKEILSLKSGIVFTLNLDHLYLLRRSKAFRSAYSEADVVTCDSTYIYLALRLAKVGISEKITGSDLVPAFCESRYSDPDSKIFLLGGTGITAAKAKEAINSAAGRSIVVGAVSPSMNFVASRGEQLSVINQINRSKANVLIVGLGAPKQEIWIIENQHRLPNVKFYFAAGATIDYIAGTRPRAPTWIQSIGMEWFYRIATEPRRYLRRYLRDLEFFWFFTTGLVNRRED